MKKIALVTGATAGIGKAVATTLAENGYELIITGRRADRLEQLQKELTEAYQVKVLSLNFDIRNQEDVDNAIDSLSGSWKDIDVLVNNAGLAVGLEPVHAGVVDDWDRMIDTNVKGLLYISRKVSSLMVKQGKGHIINISSIAGHEAYPNGAAYCATKHAVQAITKAMRIELLPYGIKVGVIGPGMVDTEFSTVRFKGDKQRADNVYKGFTPLAAQDIADALLFMITRPAHVTINDMVIMPTAQGSARDVYRTE